MPPPEPGPAPGATDPAKLDRAVAFVNAQARGIGVALVAIGEYLLREFFDGNAAAVSRRSPEKMNSLRDLAARPDLELSYSTLWRAVQLAVQAREVGIDSPVNQLDTSHAIELLAEESLARKEKLAKRALNENWSKRRLGEEVRKGRPARESLGLAPLRDALRRIAEAADRGPLAPESIDDLPRAKLEKIAPLMRSAAEALARVLPIAESVLAQSPAAAAKVGARPRSARERFGRRSV